VTPGATAKTKEIYKTGSGAIRVRGAWAEPLPTSGEVPWRPMLAKLLLLFTVVPLVELVLLLEIGRRIGTLAALVLIVATGIAGALLAKRQGLGVLRRIQAELAAGHAPAAAIVDGLIILVAGALLVTPGLLTDVVGFLCLVPMTRRTVRAVLWRLLARAVQQGRGIVYLRFDDRTAAGPPPPGPDRDADWRRDA
jgi:UPF0716 protein FxsA